MPEGTVVVPAADLVASRQCGRCRVTFAGDATLFGGQPNDWWVCDNCQNILLPRRAAAVRIEGA